MAKHIDLIYNPYIQAASLLIDHNKFSRPGSRIQKMIVGKPMQDWLEPLTRSYLQWNGFLHELLAEINEHEFELFFSGDEEDYAIFSETVRRQQAELSGSGFRAVSIELSHSLRFASTQILERMRVLRKNWDICVPTQKLLFERDRLDVRLEKDMNKEEMFVLVEDYIELIRRMQRSVPDADKEKTGRMLRAWESLLEEECV